jgi:hypothetical protein
MFWATASLLQEQEPSRRRATLIGAIAASGLFSVFLGNAFWSKSTIPIDLHPGRLAMVRRFSAQIDSQGTLFATQRVAAHFVQQRYLYIHPPVPRETDYALLDLRDSWRGATGNLGWLQQLRRIQREVEAIPALHLAGAEDGLLFYSRHDPPYDARRIVERDALPPGVNRAEFDTGHGVRIIAFSATELPAGARVTAYSGVAAPTNVDLAVRCVLQSGSDTYASDFQPLGQGTWPVVRWETNRYYEDTFIVALPAGVAQEHSAVSFEAVALAP